MNARRSLVVLACAALAMALGAAAARSGADEALALVRAGRFAEARSALDQPGEDLDPAAALALRSLLAVRPDAALTALDGAVAALQPGDPRALAARLDAAAIRFARGDLREVLQVLAPLVDGDAAGAPGRALLLAGLSRAALGDAEGASALLATVKPQDPAFPAARTALGDLALAAREPAKALRYYDNAGEASRTGAGRWAALRMDGRNDEADRLLRRLEADDPGCVSLLDIRRRLRAEAEDAAARRATAKAAPDTASAPVAEGRYTLQLGAFSDRGLALDLVRRFADQVPDLRIDTRRDERGQFLYKVRTGRYVNPALARSEAERLERSLGIGVFVAESDD